MNSEKRALIAIVLSLVILLAVPPIILKLFPGLKTTKTSQPVHIKKDTTPEKLSQIPSKAVSIEQARPSPDQELDFETEEYKVKLSSLGGVINKITLKKHLSDKNKPIELANVVSPQDSIFSLVGLDPELDKGVSYSTERTSNAVVFKTSTKSGLNIEKEITFQPGKYVIELKQTIKNNTNQARLLKYKIVGGSGITNLSAHDEAYVAVIRNINDKITSVGLGSVKNETVWEGGRVYWVSLKNRYFSLILKPPVTFSNVFSKPLPDKGLETGVETLDLSIEPNSSVTQTFILYAGPNEFDGISSLKLDIEDSLYVGFIGGIGRILFVTLKFFDDVVKNWGIAIILLTILINLISFPFTLKSLKSMKQMQALQPKIEALRAAHKGNPQRLNQEIMAIYKKYKINPLGGCLPMLLQMPIFFALYQVLMRSIELRGATFLWIRDLSQPDRLVANLPIFPNELNLLPLLMAGAMFFQQKQSASPKSSTSGAPDQMAQQQKMMMIMMPILFGVLFYNLPSGLVLYWFLNSVLTIIGQGIFLKPQMFHVEHLENK